MPKIAITTSSFGEHSDLPVRLLKDAGFELVFNPHGRTLRPEEIPAVVGNSAGIIAGTEKMSSSLLSQLPSLKVISRVGTGLESIDLNAAKQRSIEIFNTPDAPTQAVAELAVGMMLNLLRHVSRMDRDMHQGKWKTRTGSLLYGKKVGIVGLGRIGKKAADLLAPFQVELGFYDPHPEVSHPKAIRKTLNELLEWADLITLHCPPGGGDCPALLGAPELKRMKRGSYLINISRGSLVDENALTHALSEGLLAGAALDVFLHEPYHGPLTQFENVLLTCHAGSAARECRIQMEMEAAQNLVRAFKRIEAITK